MQGIITKGADFFKAVQYDLGLRKGDNKIVRVLAWEGIDLGWDTVGDSSPRLHNIVRSFQMQASLNPRVEKPVKHIALSWPSEDSAKLGRNELKDVARLYLSMMGISNTQFLITEHKETDNPHIHILLNMVNNDGKKISDYMERKRNVEVCRQITLERGYTWGRHKTFHHCQIPQDSESRCFEYVRYYMAKAIAQAISEAEGQGHLHTVLEENGTGISVEFTRDDRFHRDIVFSMTARDSRGKSKKYSIPGWKIDKRFSFENIKWLFEYRDKIAEDIGMINNVVDSLTKENYPLMPENIEKRVQSIRDLLPRFFSEEDRLVREMPNVNQKYKNVLLSLLFPEVEKMAKFVLNEFIMEPQKYSEKNNCRKECSEEFATPQCLEETIVEQEVEEFDRSNKSIPLQMEISM